MQQTQCFIFKRNCMSFLSNTISQVPLVEQELPTLPEHLSSPTVFSGVRVTRSLVLGACFVEHYLSFWTFSFGRCVVCSSSTYGFWLFLWYLQTLLTIVEQKLLTLPEHPSSGSFLVRFMLLHLYIYVWCFVDHCILLLLHPLSFDHLHCMTFFELRLLFLLLY